MTYPFVFSFFRCPTLDVFGRKRARARFRRRRESVEAPALAIDSLEYRDFKSYYHQHTLGCHQWRTAPRSRTRSSRVLSFGPGRSVRIPLVRFSFRSRNANGTFWTFLSRTMSVQKCSNPAVAREFGIFLCQSWIRTSERSEGSRVRGRTYSSD